MSSKPTAHTKAATWLQLLHEIADAADGIALRHFRRADLRVDGKSDGSPVSEADQAIETMARDLVAKRSPGMGVFGEEEGETQGNGSLRLIIDPIDGTRNFVRGIPVFAALLAVEEEGNLVAGMVSAPAMRQRWYAARGNGAFLGPRRLHVSAITEMRKAHLFHGDLSGHTEGLPPAGMLRLIGRAERTRGFGDFYQHMLVAEGAGEIALDPKMKPWDVAAVKIIVEEAGGKSTSFAGDDSIDAPNLASTNGHLHETTINMLSNRHP